MPRAWKKIQVIVGPAHDPRPFYVTATLFGPFFAVHQTVWPPRKEHEVQRWTVTHRPTGRAIRQELSRRDAVRVATRLRDHPRTDRWDFLNPLLDVEIKRDLNDMVQSALELRRASCTVR